MTPDQESTYWDSVASEPSRIDAEVYSDLDLAECMEAIEEGIGPALQESALVLELGCGVGRLTNAFAHKYPTVQFVGVDSSELMIRVAQAQADQATYVHTDGRNLFAMQPFDAAYSMTMFQHIPPQAQRNYIQEVYRVLKPSGVFRFQYVEDGDQAPFSYPVHYGTVARWVSQAGFPSLSTQHGLIKPAWGWATATK